MEKKNIALITGVTGQDGSYLSEFLLAKGYEVHGIIRRSSVDFRERIAHLEGTPNFHLHYGDLGDTSSLVKVIGSQMYPFFPIPPPLFQHIFQNKKPHNLTVARFYCVRVFLYRF